MEVKLYIGVEVQGLIIQDVHVFTDPAKQFEWFKETTGVDYWEYTNRLAEGEDSDCILSEDWDQTKLFNVTVDVPVYDKGEDIIAELKRLHDKGPDELMDYIGRLVGNT